MNDIEKRARELLSAELDSYYRTFSARMVRAGGLTNDPMIQAALRAIIATLTPPDGWVLMPRVLTEEMLQAGYPADDAQEGYEAMIAARPEVP